MKGKIKRLFGCFMATVASFACLAACETPVVTHSHTYGNDWAHDNEYHWHAATCEHTAKQGEKALHTFTVKESVEATCTTEGYTMYECICGYTYKTDEKAALGHNIVKYAGQEASCTEDGATGYEICTRCDYKTESEKVEKSGHKFLDTVWAYDNEAHWHPAVCGHNDEKTEPEEHDFSNGAVCICGFKAEEEGNFLYVRGRDGYTVTGLSAEGAEKTFIRLPLSYNNEPVTAIAAQAFEGNEILEKVVVSSNVTTVGREAFRGCKNLTSVRFDEGLTTIQYTAFSGCTSLKEVTLPESLRTVMAYAFENCASLTSIALPENLETLGEQTFSGCVSLEAVEIPAGIKKIGDNTFLGCSALAEVTLHSGLQNIGAQAFANCTSLTGITLPEGLLSVGQNAFKRSGLTEITLPDTVERLGSYAFVDCESLVSATLSKNIAYTLGNWFSGCGSLETLSVPFVGNNVSINDAVSKAFGYIFGSENKGEKFVAVEQLGKTYYIPKTLKNVTVFGGTIANGAFSGCNMIENITVAKEVTTEENAFENCSANINQLS